MLGLKKIDIYIIRKFLGTFFFALGLIIVVSVVFDFSEKVDDFIEQKAPLNAILGQYYLNFIPYFSNLYTHLFVFIAVIYFTSKMATHSEIIAILSCGVSYRRMLRPYFLSALVIAVLSFFLGHYVIPHANINRLKFEEKYFKKAYRNPDKNIHKQVSPGVFVYLERYNTRSDYGTRFSMEKIEDGQLVSKMMAASIRWDSTKQKWKAKNYWIRDVDGLNEKIITGNEMDTALNLHPEEFKRAHNIVESMPTPQLKEFIYQEKSRGQESEHYYLELYRRTAAPFAVFIMTLIGVSLSSRKLRGGVGMHIGFGIALSFSYILFMQIFKEFAISGSLKPIMGVWLPNIIYTVIALYLYRIAPK
ncbi:MAG: LptF/LptG family permease [Bacteroidales bacterium]|nr:LptF/LptG family permease [Bacteroidales bacterium]